MRFRFFVCETFRMLRFLMTKKHQQRPLYAVDVLHTGDVRPVKLKTEN